MDKLLPLIQLDKVYGGGRDTIKLVHDKFFMVRPRPDHEGEGGERHSFMFTQLLFDTDSGFLQSLEWKGQMIASSTIEVHEFITTEYRDNTRQYHSMILAQMTSDEDRIQYILDNTLLPN